MKLNKPKYALHKNGMYALEGLIEIFNNEVSFQIEVFLFFGMSVLVFCLNLDFVHTSILFISLFLPILAEITNSAIERTVDLVAIEYHILAKNAKDAGSALVLISLLVTALIWITVLLQAFVLV